MLQGFHYDPDEWPNPAEYIMQTTSDQGKQGEFIDHYKNSELYRTNEQQVLDILEEAKEQNKPQLGDMQFVPQAHGNYFHETKILLQRSFWGLYTDKQFIAARMIPRVLMSFAFSSVWSDIGDNGGSDVTNRISLIFMVATFSIMISTLFVPYILEDRPLFSRERNDGMYSVASYFSAKALIEFPINIFALTIFFLILYYAVDFDPEPSRVRGLKNDRSMFLGG